MSRLPGLSLASPNTKNKRWPKPSSLDVRKRKTLELPPPPAPPVVKTRSRSLVEQRPQSISPQPTSFYIGERVAVDSMGIVGTLQFLGEAEFKEGIWAGIQLDIPGTGKNDGSVRGVRYFSCPPQTGLFVQSSKLSPLDSLSTPSLSPAHSQRGITSPDRGIPSPAMTPTHPEEDDPPPDRLQALAAQLERLELENKDLRHAHQSMLKQHADDQALWVREHEAQRQADQVAITTEWKAKLEELGSLHAAQYQQALEAARADQRALQAAQRELKEHRTFFPHEALQQIDQAQLEEQILALQDAAHAKDIFLTTLSQQVELHRSAAEDKERALLDAQNALQRMAKDTSDTIDELKRAGLESLELYESSVQHVHRLERDAALLAQLPSESKELPALAESFRQKENALHQAHQQALAELHCQHQNALDKAQDQKDALLKEAQAQHQIALEQKDALLKEAQAQHQIALEQKDALLKEAQAQHQIALEQKDALLKEAQAQHPIALEQKDALLKEAQAQHQNALQDVPEPTHWAEKYQALEEAHQQTELECLKLLEEIERLDPQGDLRAIQTRHTTELRECREAGEEKARELTRTIQGLNKDISELEGLIESNVFKEADLEEALESERKQVKKLESDLQDLRDSKPCPVAPPQPKNDLPNHPYCELCEVEGHDVISCQAISLQDPSKYGL
ncbi:hypothetical protein BY458DRAFT_551659 [Sporodiniella umbellata]|nr:hypothetical protein BY458DRAFT_551659 [Sporodiniella umbellata]